MDTEIKFDTDSVVKQTAVVKIEKLSCEHLPKIVVRTSPIKARRGRKPRTGLLQTLRGLRPNQEIEGVEYDTLEVTSKKEAESIYQTAYRNDIKMSRKSEPNGTVILWVTR